MSLTYLFKNIKPISANSSIFIFSTTNNFTRKSSSSIFATTTKDGNPSEN